MRELGENNDFLDYKKNLVSEEESEENSED